MRWIASAIAALDKDDDFVTRWAQATGSWDISTLRLDTQGKVKNLRAWEFHADHDAATDTLYDIYYSKFILNKLGSALGVSIDEWLKKPRFLCDRDIKVVNKCNSERSKALDDAMGDLTDDD